MPLLEVVYSHSIWVLWKFKRIHSRWPHLDSSLVDSQKGNKSAEPSWVPISRLQKDPSAVPKNLPSLGQTLIPNVLLSYQLPPALEFGLIKFPLKQMSYKHSRTCCTCSSLDNITPWISTESETDLICQCLCSLSPWRIAHRILRLSALLILISQTVLGSTHALSLTLCVQIKCQQ